jgi:hypothetical protein
MPNKYDWRLAKSDLSYSMFHSRVMVRIQEEIELKRLKMNKQIHIYCNNKNIKQINSAYKCNFTYADLFNELFMPSEALNKKIENTLRVYLNNGYWGVQLRFMDLLGDFNEKRFAGEISEDKKTELLELCFDFLKSAEYARRYIFFSSDSKKFLAYITEKIPHTYFIPGDTTHMDRGSDASLAVHEKTFLDFFVLGLADKVVNIYGHGLYKSGFSQLAAELLNKPFEAINIDE